MQEHCEDYELRDTARVWMRRRGDFGEHRGDDTFECRIKPFIQVCYYVSSKSKLKTYIEDKRER